jgi:hypothetical protein
MELTTFTIGQEIFLFNNDIVVPATIKDFNYQLELALIVPDGIIKSDERWISIYEIYSQEELDYSS